MPKKKETGDTAKTSALTSGEATPAAVEPTVVSSAEAEDVNDEPKVMSLDDLDAFDPSATHEDYSEDDQFDDDDDTF